MSQLAPFLISIDYRKKASIVEQIIDDVKRKIANHDYPTGTLCEDTKIISEQNQIEENDVRVAFDKLVDEGYLKKLDGAYRVEPVRLLNEYYNQIIPLSEAIARSGFRVSFRNLKIAYMKSLPPNLRAFATQKVSKYIMIRRLFHADQFPVFIVDMFYDAKLFEGVSEAKLDTLQIYAYLTTEKNTRITHSKRLISVRVASPEMNQLLNNPKDCATIQTEVVGFNEKNEAVEFAIGYTMSNYSILSRVELA